MLLEMHIKDIAIINQAYLEFDKGLNVFTGETGAGKTLIITAVNMLLGDRADTTLIRTGRSRASIEGLFCIENESEATALGFIKSDITDDVAIVREILEEGKSKCYINGKIVNVGQLEAVGERLVDLHGQHEHQSLLKLMNHIAYLDAFGGEEMLQCKSAYKKAFDELMQKKSRLGKLESSLADASRQQDLLKFQIDEIQRANLQIGEDEELEKTRQVLAHAEKLQSAASICLNLISDSNEPQSSASDLLRQAIAKLHEVGGIDEDLDKICRNYEPVVYTMEDFVQSLRSYSEQIEYDPALLDGIEERLGLLSLLKKKYGSTLKDILDFLAKAQQELDGIVCSDEDLARLREDIEQEEVRLAALGAELSKKRQKHAVVLQKRVQKHLSELNMPKVKFEIRISHEPDENGLEVGSKKVKASVDGIDQIEFYIAPNPGEPPKPLQKIASGGELSRIMLAIKISLSDADDISTLIFDEVDAGIGGKTAFSVGQKLAHLAQKHQVVCITHLPQIASFADRHFSITKKQESGKTITSVKILDDESRLNEIARMLSGEALSEVSKKYAAETIKNAQKLKEGMRKGRYAAV